MFIFVLNFPVSSRVYILLTSHCFWKCFFDTFFLIRKYPLFSVLQKFLGCLVFYNFQMNVQIIFSSFQNSVGILIGITINLHLNFGKLGMFIVFSLSIQEHVILPHLHKSCIFPVKFCNFLQPVFYCLFLDVLCIMWPFEMALFSCCVVWLVSVSVRVTELFTLSIYCMAGHFTKLSH